MPVQHAFDYGIVRLVPRVERGEFINVGVIVLCRARRFLAARIEFDPARSLALWPTLDLSEVQSHLDLIPRICRGGPEAGAIGELSQTERFHWLVAPRSTIIQVSPPHSGLCDDPATTLADLLQKMVSPIEPVGPTIALKLPQKE